MEILLTRIEVAEICWLSHITTVWWKSYSPGSKSPHLFTQPWHQSVMEILLSRIEVADACWLSHITKVDGNPLDQDRNRRHLVAQLFPLYFIFKLISLYLKYFESFLDSLCLNTVLKRFPEDGSSVCCWQLAIENSYLVTIHRTFQVLF